MLRLNIHWRNWVGSTSVYSKKIQHCLYGGFIRQIKMCADLQQDNKVSLYVVSYPKDWNLWNSTHSYSWALDSGKWSSSCRERAQSAHRKWDQMGPEQVWRYRPSEPLIKQCVSLFSWCQRKTLKVTFIPSFSNIDLLKPSGFFTYHQV